MSIKQSVTERRPIAAGTGLGPVHLSVTNGDRALRFWRDTLGLTLMSEVDGRMRLGAGGRELVVLYTGATRPVPGGTTGLYHVAIHLPSRKELARAVRRLFARRYPNSPTDHVATETTYLRDPDGNGIELTFETPERGRLIVTPEGVPGALDADGNFRSGRDPLDLASLFGELIPGEPLEAPLGEGAKIGRVHLHVADINEAMRFYRDALGFEVRTDLPMTQEGSIRWLTLSPKGQPDLEIVLAPITAGPMFDAETAEQMKRMVESGVFGIGVFETDDIHGDYERLSKQGVEFVSPPEEKFYGTEAIVKDNSGNWFSLTQPKR